VTGYVRAASLSKVRKSENIAHTNTESSIGDVRGKCYPMKGNVRTFSFAASQANKGIELPSIHRLRHRETFRISINETVGGGDMAKHDDTP
jgi:hypothetical protein